MDREHILCEIRRTAEENGGTPLGWRRFLTETGIKESDWLGRYWARWSEALREAGFTPNQLEVGYEDSELLEKYARFVRDIGHLPTDGDMRLKATNDPEFPTDKPFRRFGKKADLVRKLIEHCRTCGGYDDVIQLCEEYTPRTRREVGEGQADEAQDGFVYLIKSSQFYKIGKTNAVGRREYELAIQLPERATTVHVIRTDDPSGIEAYWHRRFERKHKNGEWFELGPADVAAFKRRKFM